MKLPSISQLRAAHSRPSIPDGYRIWQAQRQETKAAKRASQNKHRRAALDFALRKFGNGDSRIGFRNISAAAATAALQTQNNQLGFHNLNTAATNCKNAFRCAAASDIEITKELNESLKYLARRGVEKTDKTELRTLIRFARTYTNYRKANKQALKEAALVEALSKVGGNIRKGFEQLQESSKTMYSFHISSTGLQLLYEAGADRRRAAASQTHFAVEHACDFHEVDNVDKLCKALSTIAKSNFAASYANKDCESAASKLAEIATTYTSILDATKPKHESTAVRLCEPNLSSETSGLSQDGVGTYSLP